MHPRYSFLCVVVAIFANNAGATPTPKCNSDNLLRALRGHSDQASSFCRTYTLSPATTSQPYPTYISQWSTDAPRVSSACNCLNSGTPGTTTTTASVAATLKCNSDNVLRALRGHSSDAQAFCQTYTLSAATVRQSYPSYISQYSTQATRISSACTCLLGTATTTASSDPWHDPSPTATKTDGAYSDPTPIGTVTGISIPIQTGSVKDGIPPVAAKSAFHGALIGENGEKVFLAVTDLTAKPDWPLVKLDDLIPGLDPTPECGEGTISLTFADESNYNIAMAAWTSQFILVTSGHCGNVGQLNFFRSSIKSSTSSTILLNAVATEVKDALSGLDTRFGHVPNPNVPENRKRSIEKRDAFTDFIEEIIGAVVGFVEAVIDYIGDGAKVTTSSWRIDSTFGPVIEIADISIACWQCGLQTFADIFGQAKIDFDNLSETGLLLGLEFTNPSMVLDLIFDIDKVASVSEEYIFAEAPIFYAIAIPNILEIGPLIQYAAAAEVSTTSGFAWAHVGFTAAWDSLQLGYNFVTKQPFLGGNVIPTSFNAMRGFFGTDRGVTRQQEIDVDVWAGPRAKFGVTLGGFIDVSADLTFKFPAIHISASPKDAAECGGDPAKDICVNLGTSLEMSLNADFDAGILDFASVGAGFTIWSQQIPQAVYDGDFLITDPEIIPGS